MVTILPGEDAFNRLRQQVSPSVPTPEPPTPMGQVADTLRGGNTPVNSRYSPPSNPARFGDGKFGLPDPQAVPERPQMPSSGGLRRTAQMAEKVGNTAGKLVSKIPAGLRDWAKPSVITALGTGALEHFNDYKLNDPDVDSSAMGTLRAFRDKGWDAGLASAGKGAIEAGMDLGSSVANLADYVVPGKAPVSTAYNRMLRNHFGPLLQDNSGTQQPGVNPEPVSGKPMGAPPAAGAPDAQADPAALPTTSSGSQGLRNVSVVPSPTPDVRGTQERASVLNGQIIDQARQNDAFGAGAHSPDGSGGVAGIQGNTLGGPASAAAFRDAVARSDLQRGINDAMRNPRTAAAALQAAEGLQGLNTQRDVATLREQGETTRANARNATEMRQASLRAGVETRGQDVGLKGHMYQADTSLRGQMAQMLRDQFNKDRDFNQHTDELQHNWSSEATKKLTDEFTSTLPQIDGKPDSERASRYANALPNFVSSRIQGLQDHLKQNPNDAEAQQKLQILQRKGADSITNNPQAKAKFLAGMQLGDVISSTATNGLTPWGTRAVDSGQPVTELRKMPNGDYITDRKGVNGEPEIIPGRYIEKQGGIFGFLGKDSNRFKSLIKE